MIQHFVFSFLSFSFFFLNKLRPTANIHCLTKIFSGHQYDYNEMFLFLFSSVSNYLFERITCTYMLNIVCGFLFDILAITWNSILVSILSISQEFSMSSFSVLIYSHFIFLMFLLFVMRKWMNDKCEIRRIARKQKKSKWKEKTNT